MERLRLSTPVGGLHRIDQRLHWFRDAWEQGQLVIRLLVKEPITQPPQAIRVEPKSLRISEAFPVDLAVVGLLALLLLGLNEHYCGRLTWRRLGEREVPA